MKLSRRDLLKLGGVGIFTAGGAAALTRQPGIPQPTHSHTPALQGHGPHQLPGVGEVNHEANGFDPMSTLTDFAYGKISILPGGQTLREYEVTVINKEIEIVPGIKFAAWTYNGRIPGPTLRANQGDRIRVHFINGSNHPHSMHFHGFHPAEMDGVPGSGGVPEPGEEFIYEFDAEPFGVHLYHCHAFPLARHIAKGV